MPRMIFIYCCVFAIFFFGIDIFRKLTMKEKWKLTKLLTYSVVCATLAFLVLVSLVIFF